MGYESKFYIVNTRRKEETAFKTIINGKEMFYGEKIAMFDMSKVYSVLEGINKYSETNIYIYADDGNTEIIEDAYGDELIEIPIKDMIEIIEKAMQKDTYRRFNPFLSMLKGFDENEWNELVVLHYGY